MSGTGQSTHPTDRDVTVSDASRDDIARIVRVWMDGWHEAHAALVPPALLQLRTAESFGERALKKLPVTRVARCGRDIVGFSMTQGEELDQLYVAAEARGTGAARALIEDAETRMAAAGHETVWLACSIGNARAMRFYEKSGWTNAGRRTVDLDTSDGPFPLEVWRYEKRLARPRTDRP